MTRTKREPRREPNANQDLARGVRLLPPRPDRPNPYGVQWSERAWDHELKREVRAVKTEFYAQGKHALKRARELSADRLAGRLATASHEEVRNWRAFCAATEGTPWQDVVAAWRTARSAGENKRSTVTVGAFVADALEKAEKDVQRNQLAPDTARQKRHKLKRFAAQLGSRLLVEVTTDDVAGWLDSLDLKSPFTYNNHLKIIRALLQTAVPRYRSDNPALGVAKMKSYDEPNRILTPPEVARLFHVAQNHVNADGRHVFRPVVARLALEFFAGVRFGSATRLTRDNVNFTERGIMHTAATIKTRRRQYVEGYPLALWLWLRKADPSGWDLTPRQYLQLKSGLFTAAGVAHPRNCARHSFASYHVAAFKNPGLTAFLLCHVNQRKLWETYKGNATALSGQRYMRICPQTAGRIAADFQPDAPRPWRDRP